MSACLSASSTCLSTDQRKLKVLQCFVALLACVRAEHREPYHGLPGRIILLSEGSASCSDGMVRWHVAVTDRRAACSAHPGRSQPIKPLQIGANGSLGFVTRRLAVLQYYSLWPCTGVRAEHQTQSYLPERSENELYSYQIAQTETATVGLCCM